jgi:hypothetical protein
MSVPHRRHITFLLRAQQVNAIYRSMTMVYWYNCHSSDHYPSSCPPFKTHGWKYPYLTGSTLRLCYEPSRLMRSTAFWRWFINITVTIMDIIHRPVFYLKHAMINVRTSQETHYVSFRKLDSVSVFRFPETENKSVDWASLSICHLKKET